MLSVLLVSVASTVAMRVSLSAQTYNQLAQTAGDAGLAYAKACLDANGGVPTWTDANPLTPSTDCSGNQLAGFTCPDGTADSRCAVSVNGGATAQVLVVGGGGGGGPSGNGAGGGGGGAGGVLPNTVVLSGNVDVVVGTGGTGSIPSKGGSSSFGALMAQGGGTGGGFRADPNTQVASSTGGSGGGAGYGNYNVLSASIAFAPELGHAGGVGITSGTYPGGGGGGAGDVGGVASANVGGNGGPGYSSSITGTPTYYGGGGGAGSWGGTAGSGSSGGGGNGSTTGAGGNATANTGGGGGGGTGLGAGVTGIGGTGGSGIVIISYPNDSITASGCTSSVRGAVNTVCTFTASGTFTVTATTANSSPVVSTFSVGLPTLVNGKANEINSVGSSKLLKSSDNSVWRRYNQSSKLTIPAVVVVVDPIIFGSGADGAITVAAGKNINTDTIATGRTCADAVNYSVTALTTNSATLSTTPVAGCLVAGDEMLLINLQGINANFANAGNYETVRIQSISTNTVTFTANKTKYYGNGASDDTNIGTATTNQRVMLQRIPNYTNVTINSGITLTANAWDGTKSGVLFFRANGTLANSGIITMSGFGYRGGTQGGTANLGGQGGESFCGVGGNGVGTGTGGAGAGGGGSGYPAVAYGGAGFCGGGGGAYPQTGAIQGIGSVASGGAGGGAATHGGGGGAGYGTFGGGGINGGTNSSGNASMWGGGGGTYGIQDLTKLYLGSGGGKGGDANSGTAANGGNGGGIVVIMANITTITGTLSNSGANGVAKASCVASEYSGAGGGGSGGSILIRGNTVSVVGSTTVALAGAGGNASCTNAVLGANYNGYSGGVGRIAIYYTTLTGTTNPAAYSP